jgi:hypothetical protein
VSWHEWYFFPLDGWIMFHCCCVTFCVMDIWIVSPLCLLWMTCWRRSRTGLCTGFSSLECVQRSGIAWVTCHSIFNTLRNCQTVFQTDSTNFQSNQQHTGLRFLHTLSKTCHCAPYSDHPRGCAIVSSLWFDLHFPSD